MRLLLIFLLLASSALAQSSTGGDVTVTSSTAGSTNSVLGSRAWAPGPMYPYLPIATVDVTPPDTSSYTVLADTTSYADLVSKIATAAAGCDNGHTGYVINIPQGVIYSATSQAGLVIPATTCTSSWIVIQTKGLTWTPGLRIDPSTVAGTLAKITSANNAGIVISTAPNIPGVNHYWFRGLDVEMTATTAVQLLINLTAANLNPGGLWTTAANLPDHIVLDHIYGHGRAQNNTLGITLGGSYIAVVDSWLSDFKSTNNDAQAINGFAGGPWLVQNNFIEASTENVMFGGSNIGPVNTVEGISPHDYTERLNWVYKPLQWQGGTANFSGVGAAPFHWDVKNMHEYKFCVRCLVENEILENFWAANQVGQSLLSNQAAIQNGPYSLESDHTFRNLHVIGGVGAFEGQGRGGIELGGDIPRSYRIMFQNILVEGMSVANFDPLTTIFLPVDLVGFAGQMSGVIVDHFTSTAPFGVSREVAGFHNIAVDPFDIGTAYLSNSIMGLGNNGFHTNGGGSNNLPADPIKYWGGGQAPGFYNNVFTDSSHQAFSCTTWNAATSGTFVGNQCPTDMTTVGFVNWTSARGGDYRLCTGVNLPAAPCAAASPYAANGAYPCHVNPDGTGALTDCGANVAQILALTAGLDTVPSLWPDSRSGGGITLTPNSLTCNNSNTVVITPNAGTNGGSLFVQSGLDVTWHAAVVTPTTSSTTSITIRPPTYSGSVSITNTVLSGGTATITNTSLTGNVMTFTAAAGHSLRVGESFKVVGSTNGGGVFNVASAVVTTVTATTWTAALVHADVTGATDTGTETSLSGGNLMTFTTSATHGLHDGDLVTITGTSNGSGVFNITAQPVTAFTSNTFRVPFTHAGVNTAADSGSGTSTLPVAVSNMGLPLVAPLTCN